ncbi:Glycoprotein-N-acetylgalactosamine 3-beta-galactosyltransferase 1 [Strongyloides ratti]|uniref:N-acetylgalactosaminide beta-1,3-galactosyltransferase n=1 Tax=Strongyloides ratti TaxID=34506 RepID=A0A090LGC7_STRRB|nr:Glycoprotein-N-acetylgalactosamine 3-beta-galactosyltransferase 1 [Strongyloides ratti]CEF68856.1 Glycoprotein-N-acetylgalactosamine 3-beta-galactosyltransferase 1 [Strongyloides ratti]
MIALFFFPKRYIIILFLISILFYGTLCKGFKKKDKLFLKKEVYFSNATNRVHNEVVNIMKKKVRIFCVILAGYKHKKSRIIPQLKTWVKRCDGYIYATGVADKSINSIRAFSKDSYEYSYAKVRNGLKYVYKKFKGQYDFILKSDSDAYIIMENLRMYLHNRNPDEHLYSGYQMYTHTSKINPKFPLNQGGVGYVLSRRTVKDLVEKGFKNGRICLKRNDGFEDVEIARCLKNMKIYPNDARDYKNRELFFPTDPVYVVGVHKNMPAHPYYRSWSVHMYESKVPMSDFPIGFHWVSNGMMEALEYLLYNVNVAGLQNKFFSLNDDDDEIYKNKIKYSSEFLSIFSENYFK